MSSLPKTLLDKHTLVRRIRIELKTSLSQKSIDFINTPNTGVAEILRQYIKNNIIQNERRD